MTDKDDTRNARNAGRDSNPDPITKAPGSHPVATGVGAAAAGVAGAAIGSVVPGIGTVIGGVVGTIAGAVGGGYAGKAAGEMVDPTGTDEYWRENHKSRAAAGAPSDYDRYRPAYHYGASLAGSDSTAYDEGAARSGWERNPAAQDLDYNSAKDAIRREFDRAAEMRRQRNAGKASPPM